jgi:predicted ester cyclase
MSQKNSNLSETTGRSVRSLAVLLIAVLLIVVVGLTGSAWAQTPGRESTELEESHLATFDDLDFNVYTGQKWDELGRSHAQDIVVHWPDGRTTEGIDVHIKDLQAMFVFAPDTRIEEHPIRIASGNWTAVTGTLEGTFTEPMPIGDGKTIAPTGKAFKLPMATIGRWRDGKMDEEWLFWDNQAFMKQIGLAD